ncbi:TonB-dependent receptor [Bowmanella denitrificans]|uniref:TonB-dependent receptor n=1 Tax=Bowmanella denitrificans TaxID=366582 RepID=UPI000C9AEBF0|nr:TonB-dependent receptor [Bowmanella denitrificans]
MVNTQPKRLALFVSLSLLSHTLLAQNEQQTMEEVIALASPIRDSQKAAIEAKQHASNFVDVVSADTIGRFPDQNLADSLGRIPGLAIERDQGQARYINFRGAPFRYTTLAIDGIAIPGAENGRIPRFDSFPAVITRKIEANKAVLASMPAESVAGFINIETFNPFETKGFTLATDVGYGQQSLGGGTIDKVSLRTSWSNQNIGLSLFGSQNSREQITDNREFDLEQQDGELVVNKVDMRSYQVKREDSAYGGRLEYRPQDSLDRFFFSSLYSEFQDHEQRNQYVLDFKAGAEAMGSSVAPGTKGQGLVIINRLLEDGLYENSTWANTLGADIQLGTWLVEGRINKTNTQSEFFLPIPYSAGGNSLASYDLTNIHDPLIELKTDSGSINDISNYALDLFILYGSSLDIDAWKYKLDAKTDVRVAGLSAQLQLGAMYDTRSAQGHGTDVSQQYHLWGVNPADFLTDDAWDTDFTNSIHATNYNNQALRQALEKASGGLRFTPTEANSINIDEDISVAYAMLSTDFAWGSLVTGLRLESTDYASTGPEGQHSDRFTDILPSVHLNVDVAEDVKFRASLSSAISRPTYNEWRASANIDTTEKQISGGNPALQAENAYGGDLSLEWYAGDASLLAIGAFYRHIDKVIYADSTKVDAGLYVPAFAGEQWDYSGFVNGQEGHFQGLELNLIAQASDFIGQHLDGIGFSANLTILDSEFTTLSGSRFSLPGTSDLIYNASVFYENDSLSVRLNYQFRDDWLSTTENDAMGEYWNAQKRLDLSLSYTLPSLGDMDISLYANANNLTDEIDIRYLGSEATPNQIERYGRRYMAGVRVNF